MEPLTPQLFWKCVAIFLSNFHAVNRKIFACKINSVHRVLKGLKNIEVNNALWQSVDELKLETLPTTQGDLVSHLDKFSEDSDGVQGFVLHLSLLSKKLSSNIKAVGIVDLKKCTYVCKFLSCNNLDDLFVKLDNSELKVGLLTQRTDVEKGARWCDFVLRPKLLKWCVSTAVDPGVFDKKHVSSLQLVDVEDYNELYKELKLKHAADALKFWTDAGESTDPLKFIYEDLAIAAYLICLWRSTSTTPTAFADLGCGNGLLVYILVEEGYQGYGYDIRARRLWSLYPQKIRLIEQAVEPDRFKLPAEVDWLLGNHSDELSPWLPVLAATLCPNMRYFLLPCCAFEFSGTKFQRRNSRLSVYADFLDYAKVISNTCGFKTLQDRLKIPSTKRIALLGLERIHATTEYETQKRIIWNFVRDERSTHAYNINEDIKLREKHESVRNCTQLDKNVVEQLVLKIFLQLMERSSVNNVGDDWYVGKRLSMSAIAQNLSNADLKNIKNECGGIKTLLRNKHEIFEFCGNNMVGVRKPQVRVINLNRPQTVKKRICFFQQHHPNGCPLTDIECTFIHLSVN